MSALHVEHYERNYFTLLTTLTTKMTDKEIEDLLLNPSLMEDLDLDSILTPKFVDFNQIVDSVQSPSKPNLPQTEEEIDLINQIKDQIILEQNQPHPKSIDLGIPPEPFRLEDLVDETQNWCCICNEDGSLQCTDCDEDVYCPRCFRDGHAEDLELRKHRTKRLHV